MPVKTPRKNDAEILKLQGCTFVGVQYDAKAVDAIQIIATGLIENARGLGTLANVLKASNVNLEAMIKIVDGKAEEIK